MTELMRRRRALMGAQGGELFPLYLYNEGVISPVVGSFTTDGYKYGQPFAQSQEDTYLQIISTSPYNFRGGRTFTIQSPIPRSCVGKTLRLSGTQTNQNTGVSDMRNSYVYAFISDAVVTSSDTESVIDSGSFVDSISDRQLILGANTTINLNLSLAITKTGYVSIVAYKGYNGWLDVKIDKIWIE